MGWAHHTYAEFLAADGLVRSGMGARQIIALLSQPGDPARKIVPQLHETAAWAASLVPEVFSHIREVEPEILLRSEVSTGNVESRRSLAEAFLAQCEREGVLRDPGRFERYGKLDHPALAQQLLPYLDHRKPIDVRYVAMDIAAACGCRSLREPLLDIALAIGESLEVRSHAAYAASEIGGGLTGPAVAKFRRLLSMEDDVRDDLKGDALFALWPDHLTPRQLLKNLRAPKRPNWGGSYSRFLCSHPLDRLGPDSLPAALVWGSQLSRAARHSYIAFDLLIIDLVFRAWECLDSPGVAGALAQLVVMRARDSEGLMGGERQLEFAAALAGDESRRRRLLGEMVPLCVRLDVFAPLVLLRLPLVTREDIPWLIDRLQASRSMAQKRAWAALIQQVYDGRCVEHTDALIVAARKDRTLAETFSWLLAVVRLDSPEAHEMRAQWQQAQELRAQAQTRPPAGPPPEERIADVLRESERGAAEAWPRLTLELSRDPHTGHYQIGADPDLTNEPGWKFLDPDAIGRVLQVARRYLLQAEPPPGQWVTSDAVAWPVVAAYRALRLLWKEAPAIVEELPVEVWQHWGAAALTFPTDNNGDGRSPQREVIGIAYRHEPEVILNALVLLIDKENRRYKQLVSLHKAEGCWDERFGAAMLAVAAHPRMHPQSLGDLLRELLGHGVGGARELGESWLRAPIPTRGRRRASALRAAEALLLHTPDASWPTVWRVIRRNPRFGRELLDLLARMYPLGGHPLGRALTECQLGDFYLWLGTQYPELENGDSVGDGFVSPRRRIEWLRDAVLSALCDRGTPQAVQQVRRIAERLPTWEWLRRTLLVAQANVRRSTWNPPEPVHLIRLTDSVETRYVADARQLIDILFESLSRLQRKLHGETPARIFLWNETPSFRPKDENSLSDYVKLHLEDDVKGRDIVVNREVEVERVARAGVGQRTDIHVDAVRRGSGGAALDTITVVVETKGCWHDKLQTAMQDQLVGQYLRGPRADGGIYLVGWFKCGRWDAADRVRLRRVPKWDLQTARRVFEDQATTLTEQGYLVRAFVLDVTLPD